MMLCPVKLHSINFVTLLLICNGFSKIICPCMTLLFRKQFYISLNGIMLLVFVIYVDVKIVSKEWLINICSNKISMEVR